MKILIVDENLASQKKLAHQLQIWGHQVISLRNGLDALQATQNDAFDVIITNWAIPGVKGPELCSAIRKNEQRSHHTSFIIMLTSRRTQEDLALALKSGANDFAAKPFKPLVLQARLANAQRLVNLQQTLRNEKIKADQIACTDYLTKLHNRRALWQNLNMDYARMSRENRPLSAILIDVDHFKAINDLHGHHVGDNVLKSIANCLKNNIRQGDYVGRWGGEEFLAILPGADIIQASEVAERCRYKLENMIIEGKNNNLVKLSASFGVAMVDGFYRDSTEDLIEQCDQALYWAKESGRNKVKIFMSSYWPEDRRRKTA